MPRNKRESFIYSVIMCFTMVLWMSMYNVTLHMGHLSLETIREGWIGFPFAFVYAFLFDWFIVSGPAKGIAFRYFVHTHPEYHRETHDNGIDKTFSLISWHFPSPPIK